MLILSAVADPLIRVLLSDKCEGCIILLQILCFSLMWYPIHAINLNLLTVKGRSDLFFRMEVFKKIIGVSIMVVTIPHGIIWMVSGGIVSSMISLIINTYYTGKLINVAYLKQMDDLLLILSVSFAVWIIVHGSMMMSSNIYVQLIIGSLVGVMVYLVLAKLFLRTEWEDAMSMVPDRLNIKFYFLNR